MINLNLAINSTGYGCVASNIFKKMWAKHPSLCLLPISNNIIAEPSLSNDIQKAIQNKEFFDNNRPSLKIWHQNDLFSRYSKTLDSALTFFELDFLSSLEVASINSKDLLFVASNWAKEIVEDSCNTRTVVLPMGFDANTFYYDQDKHTEDGVYRFFSCGKIEVRKGHDILYKIFNEAFDENDKVELHIKWDNPFLSDEEHENWKRLYKSSKLGNKIYFHHTNSQKELADIMQRCDCGIFPSRAEGFGLSILEMMACNKPIITTNYSAMTEFCNEDNAILIDPEGMEKAYDGKWFFGQGSWAKLGDRYIAEAAESMRTCYEKDIRTSKFALLDSAYYSNWDLCSTILNMELGLV